MDDFQAEFERLVADWTRNGAIISPRQHVPMRASARRTRSGGSSCSIRWWPAPPRRKSCSSRCAISDLAGGAAADRRDDHRQHRRLRLPQGHRRGVGVLHRAYPRSKIAEVLKVIQTFRSARRRRARSARVPDAAARTRGRQKETLDIRIVTRPHGGAGQRRRIPEIARGTGHRAWRRCRTPLETHRAGWSRGRAGHFCRTTTNTSCRRCSCSKFRR